MNQISPVKTLPALLLIGLLVFTPAFFASCDTDADNSGGSKIEVPTDLKNTQWAHRDGDTVSFGTTTVTTKPVSGNEQTFMLKDTLSNDTLNQIILFFNDDQTKDQITYRNDTIILVNVGGIYKSNGWTQDFSYTNSGNDGGENGDNAFSWTVVDSPFDEDFRINQIIYGKGVFIIGGNEVINSYYRSKILYSTDGISWTKTTVVETPNSWGSRFRDLTLAGLTYTDEDGFVAANTGGQFARSADGITWTEVQYNNVIGNLALFTRSGNRYFLESSYRDFPRTATNLENLTNRETWTRLEGIEELGAVAYGGGRFITGHPGWSSRGSSIGMLSYSDNGIVWTTTERLFDSAFYSVAYGSGRFVVEYGNGRIAYSVDGIAWTIVADIIFGVVYGNGRFVAGSSGNKMAYSVDGITWTTIPNPLGEDTIHSIHYCGGKFFVVGNNAKIAYTNTLE